MTWIIPKTLLTTYPSVLDTKALGLDLEEFSQTCEKSLTLRGKDMPQRSWQRKWKQESWLQRLSTRMLKPSHTEDFLDKWVSSQEDFHANHLAVPVNDNQPRTLDTYSPSSSKELNSVDQSLSSSKMLTASSPQKQEMEKVFSNMSSEAWKKWITQQRQEYSQRLKSAHLTREKEFTSWPTPTVAEAGKIGKTPYGQKGLSNHPQVIGEVITRPKMNKSRKGEKMNWPTPTAGMIKQDVGDQGQYAQRVQDNGHQVMLPSAVKLSNWPTPTTQEIEHPDMELTETGRRKSKDGKSSHSVNLADKVQMNWPTPQVSDMNGAANPNREAHRRQLRDVETGFGQVAPMNDNTPGKHQESSWLTPRVVEIEESRESWLKRNKKYGRSKGHSNLTMQVKENTWPTPQVHLAKETNSPAEYNRKTKSMIAVATKQPNHNLKLNPEWVEQLMGLDIGWTDLGFWATELSQPQPKKHSEFLLTG